eukprot:753953-Hanusia_phi.AAC.4
MILGYGTPGCMSLSYCFAEYARTVRVIYEFAKQQAGRAEDFEIYYPIKSEAAGPQCGAAALRARLGAPCHHRMSGPRRRPPTH